MKKRFLAMILALCLALGTLQGTALAGMLPTDIPDPVTTLDELRAALADADGKGGSGDGPIHLRPAASFWDGSGDETIEIYVGDNNGYPVQVELLDDWTIPAGKTVEISNVELISNGHKVIVEGAVSAPCLGDAVFKDGSSILQPGHIRKGDVWTIQGNVTYHSLHLEGELRGEQGRLSGDGGFLYIYPSDEGDRSPFAPVLSGKLEISFAAGVQMESQSGTGSTNFVLTIAEGSDVTIARAGHTIEVPSGVRINVEKNSSLEASLNLAPNTRVDVAGELRVSREKLLQSAEIYLGGEIRLADTGVLALDQGWIREYRGTRGKITGTGTIRAYSKYVSIDTSYWPRVFDIGQFLGDPTSHDRNYEQGAYDYRYHDVIGEGVTVWCNWDHCDHAWETKVFEPTCTRWGRTQRTCTICGQFDQDNPVNPLGHAWGEWVVVKEATETAQGSKTRTCTREGCGETETEAIPATQECRHEITNTVTITEATCTEPGERNVVCGSCGAVLRTETVSALGHSYGAWEVTEAATATAEGRRERTCGVCGDVQAQTIPANRPAAPFWPSWPTSPAAPTDPTTPDSGSLDNFTASKTYRDGLFQDVSAEAWYSGNVAAAYRLGLMEGTGADAFAPRSRVTVAEAVTLAARLHSIYYTGRDLFETGDGENWYEPYVEYARKNGLISESFHFDDPATREVFAHILAQALPAEALSRVRDETISFADADSIHYAQDVNLLCLAGVINGERDGDAANFLPQNTITRAEAAAIVTRMAQPGLRASK